MNREQLVAMAKEERERIEPLKLLGGKKLIPQVQVGDKFWSIDDGRVWYVVLVDIARVYLSELNGDNISVTLSKDLLTYQRKDGNILDEPSKDQIREKIDLLQKEKDSFMKDFEKQWIKLHEELRNAHV